MDDILKKFNLKMDDLSSAERDILFGWVEALQQNKMTVSKVKDYITSMKVALEEKLADEPEFVRVFIFSVPNRNQIFMKARLRNYIMLEAFLESPEKAKIAVEKAVANIKITK